MIWDSWFMHIWMAMMILVIENLARILWLFAYPFHIFYIHSSTHPGGTDQPEHWPRKVCSLLFIHRTQNVYSVNGFIVAMDRNDVKIDERIIIAHLLTNMQAKNEQQQRILFAFVRAVSTHCAVAVMPPLRASTDRTHYTMLWIWNDSFIERN